MATFLTPDRTVTVQVGGSTLTIRQKIIPDTYKAPKYVASYVRQGQPMKPCKLLAGTGKPKGVTIHNTEDIKAATGTNAAEQYARAQEAAKSAHHRMDEHLKRDHGQKIVSRED